MGARQERVVVGHGISTRWNKFLLRGKVWDTDHKISPRRLSIDEPNHNGGAAAVEVANDLDAATAEADLGKVGCVGWYNFNSEQSLTISKV